MAQFGSQDRAKFIEALKLRASSLLATDPVAETKSVKDVWLDGQCSIVASNDQEETAWQECLIALGRSIAPSLAAGCHFTKVIEYSCDANKVPYPHKMLRVGFPKPMPALVERDGAAADKNMTEFRLPGIIGIAVETSWSGVEQELGQTWLQGLAKSVHDLRDMIHGNANSFDTILTPWPMVPSSCVAQIDDDDVSFFGSGQYLRDRMHQDLQELDLSLSGFPLLPENVIRDDVCTEQQLKVIELRSNMSPARAKAIKKRQAQIDFRFFEEVRPALEKDAALAEMRARWARDKANAIREHDKAAEYGAQFVAWPHANERRWPKPTQPWLQRVKWFAMWRKSQRVKQEEAQKLMAKSGPKKASSCADSDTSWEVLSECSESSWQAVSEVSDTSWLELATECDVVAHMNAKISELSQIKEECNKDLQNALPALDAAVKALNCLNKADIVEIKALKSPPHGLILVAKALCYCFSVGPKKCDALKFDFWCQFKKLIGDVAFMKRLIDYDKDNISEETMARLLPFESDPCFHPDVIAKASLAGKGLCMWVRAIITYARVAKEIAPKINAMKQAQIEVDLARKELGNRTQPEAPISSMDEDSSQTRGSLLIEEDVVAVLEAAEQSLMSFDKAAVVEIKSMCKPPQPVMSVCTCVMILRPLGKEDPSLGWKGAKAMLGDPSLLRAMQEYKKEAVSSHQIERVRNQLDKEKHIFEGERMKCVSMAAYCLLQWVKAVVKYHEASQRAKGKDFQAVCAEEQRLDSPCSTTASSTISLIEDVSPLDLSVENEQETAAISFPVVNVNDLRELKCLAKPPSDIVTLLIAVFEIQIGINRRVAVDEYGFMENKSWKTCQKFLVDPGKFAQDLADFEDAVRSNRVPVANIENAKRTQQECGDALRPDVVKRKSASASGLAAWFDAVLAHFSEV